MGRFMKSAGFLVGVTATGLVVLAAACGSSEQGESESDMSDMPGMSAPGEASMGGGMMDQMRPHMDRMANLPADSLPAVLATHRQMVANMLAQMNREMTQMAMPADTAWLATVDSLRSDLIRMPGMDGEALGTMMPTHLERVSRLMAMHDAMMRAMGM